VLRIKFQEAFSYKPNADTSHLLDSLVSALAVYATAFRSKLSLLSVCLSHTHCDTQRHIHLYMCVCA